MRNQVAILLTAVVLISCASVQQRRDELQTQAPCCASIAELPYQTVDLRKEYTFELSEKSPVFNFGEGKSYTHPLSIPTSPSTRALKVRIFQQGNQGFESMKNSLVLCPTVLFLNKDKTPIVSVDLTISKAKPTSFLGPSLSEANVWHSSVDVPTTALHMVFYTKPSAFGRRNAVPIYRFTRVAEYLYVPCGPTGTVELTTQ